MIDMPIVKEKIKYTPKDVFVESTNDIKVYDPIPSGSSAIYNEYFNMNDETTRKYIISLTEDSHNTVLGKLTAKLYNHSLKKTDKIDFAEIPTTKGDITKLSNYDDLVEVIKILKNIVTEYKQDPAPVDEISTALANIQTRKDLFTRAFAAKCELPMMIYNEIVLAIYTGVSYMISACIEFIKQPRDDSFKISLDKVAYNKSKDHMIYDSLKKFNKACEKGQFDTAMNAIIKKKITKFQESSNLMKKNNFILVDTIHESPILVGAIVAAISLPVVIFLITNLIPILRELSYLFFHAKASFSDYCDTQADLLQMNAYNLENNNTIDINKKEKIIDKQMKIADRFRKIANKVAIDSKKAEAEANKELKNVKDNITVEEIENLDLEAEDIESSGSALF